MERTVEKIRRVRGLVSNLFYFMIVFVGIGAFYHTIKTGFSIGIPLGEAVIGIATLMLAFATFYLAFSDMEEGIKTREQASVEAQKDRRRTRLKEQLEEFYSPLVAHEEYFRSKSAHTTIDGVVSRLMKSLRNKYEFLAEPDLKEDLSDYYKSDKFQNLSNDDWGKKIESIIDTILNDYSNLSAEYENLTGPP